MTTAANASPKASKSKPTASDLRLDRLESKLARFRDKNDDGKHDKRIAALEAKIARVQSTQTKGAEFAEALDKADKASGNLVRELRFALAVTLTVGAGLSACSPAESDIATGPASIRPNILFISVDDLNDWIEPLGGHPQARTPNLNRYRRTMLHF